MVIVVMTAIIKAMLTSHQQVMDYLNSSHVNMQSLSLSFNLFHMFDQMETSKGPVLMWSGGLQYLKVSLLLLIYY